MDNNGYDLTFKNNSVAAIPKMINSMMDKNMYKNMLDIIDQNDEEDYSKFNELEMIYLFVHKEKDQDERKNRSDGTKKEYFRELLWIYHLLINNGEQFQFDSVGLDVYSIFKNIRRKHIRLFQDWLREVPLGKGGNPYSVSTISRKTGIFKSFMKFLYDKRYIQLPIQEAFRSASVHRTDRPNRDIHSNEALELINYFNDHDIVHCLLSVLLTTGARVMELCTSRVCDLSEEMGIGYWLEVIGKGNEKRELFIHPNVFDTIVRFRKRRGLDTKFDKEDTSSLFVTARNNPYSGKYMSKYLSEAISKADIPLIKDGNRRITPHTLRHGFAIISAEQNADVFRIMQALGHKKIETTMIYLERYSRRKTHVAHNWKDSSIIQSI